MIIVLTEISFRKPVAKPLDYFQSCGLTRQYHYVGKYGVVPLLPELSAIEFMVWQEAFDKRIRGS